MLKWLLEKFLKFFRRKKSTEQGTKLRNYDLRIVCLCNKENKIADNTHVVEFEGSTYKVITNKTSVDVYLLKKGYVPVVNEQSNVCVIKEKDTAEVCLPDFDPSIPQPYFPNGKQLNRTSKQFQQLRKAFLKNFKDPQVKSEVTFKISKRDKWHVLKHKNLLYEVRLRHGDVIDIYVVENYVPVEVPKVIQQEAVTKIQTINSQFKGGTNTKRRHLVKIGSAIFDVLYNKKSKKILESSPVSFKNSFDSVFCANHFRIRCKERFGIELTNDLIDQIRIQLTIDSLLTFGSQNRAIYKVNLCEKEFAVCVDFVKDKLITALQLEWV